MTTSINSNEYEKLTLNDRLADTRKQAKYRQVEELYSKVVPILEVAASLEKYSCKIYFSYESSNYIYEKYDEKINGHEFFNDRGVPNTLSSRINAFKKKMKKEGISVNHQHVYNIRCTKSQGILMKFKWKKHSSCLLC
jgi:hypothetical protein